MPSGRHFVLLQYLGTVVVKHETANQLRVCWIFGHLGGDDGVDVFWRHAVLLELDEDVCVRLATLLKLDIIDLVDLERCMRSDVSG